MERGNGELGISYWLQGSPWSIKNVLEIHNDDSCTTL